MIQFYDKFRDMISVGFELWQRFDIGMVHEGVIYIYLCSLVRIVIMTVKYIRRYVDDMLVL